MFGTNKIIFKFLILSGLYSLLFPQSHFNFSENTGNYMPVFLGRLTLRGGPLTTNDEIGIFDNDLCVGGIEYSGQMWTQLIAWEDDEWTGDSDGFIPGNNISFRFWDESLAEEIDIENVQFIGGGSFDTSGVFNSNSMVRVHLSALTPQNFNVTETFQFQIIQLEYISIRNNPVLPETELGIFADNFLSGGGIYSGEISQQLFVWMDDSSTSIQDGFYEGDSLSIYYHDETGDSLLGPLTIHYLENQDLNFTGQLYEGTTTIVNLSTDPDINIHSQEILEDESFAPINLPQSILDPDDSLNELIIQFSGQNDLIPTIENNFLIIYISEPHWFGTEYISISAEDPNGGFDILEVSFTALPVNDQPQISNLDLEIYEDSEAFLPLIVSDVDGDELTLILQSEPQLGTFDTENFLYTPFENVNGMDLFSLIAFDGILYSELGLVSLLIHPVNDIPFVNAGEDLIVNENDTIQVTGIGWDVEGNVSFYWVGDSTLQIINPENPTTNIIAPEIDENIEFSLTLYVTDSSGYTVSDSLLITVIDLGDTDVIHLNQNWNLISFDIQLNDIPPESLFANAIDNENLVYITGYDSISFYFDPFGPSFLNTLSSFESGLGYWVKVFNEDVISQISFPIPNDFSIQLYNGWNLIGYWLQGSTTPAIAFDELIQNNNLIYVTSFGPEGAQFYEPGGIFNTLDIVENGSGYWVKVVEDVQNFQYPPNSHSINKIVDRPTNPNIVKTNTFMFINGTISWGENGCEPPLKVDVLTDTGILVGEIPIFENKYLKTSVIYGDDPTTEEIDGALYQQSLGFYINDQKIQSDRILFNGNMELVKLSLKLDFKSDQFSYFNSFPNPFNSTTTIQYSLGKLQDPNSISSITIYDINGREIIVFPVNQPQLYKQSITWNGLDKSGNSVSSGIYFCTIKTENYIKNWKLVLLK